MPATRAGKVWTVIILLLLLTIISEAIIIRLRMPHNHPVEITLASPAKFSGRIYIDGAVNSPGFYPYRPDDNITNLLNAAGGVTESADLTDIRISVMATETISQSQKIDINRAESWLLEALPGIGEVLAGRIIEYREQNGLFRNINELTQVEGISVGLYEKIKPLITVSE